MRCLLLFAALGITFTGCATDVMSNGSGGVDAAEPGPSPDAGPTVAADDCEPPDLMIILDRTGSMSLRPDGSTPPNTASGAEESKWHLAVSTIESVSAKFDETVAFGLSLFPADPDGAGGADCSNIDTWLEQWLPDESTDELCQPGETLVSPAVGAASAIDSAIDTMGTGLCSSTPIGAGLATAAAELDQIQSGREQYALLITDGVDNCDDTPGYSTNSLAHADALFAAGRKLFVLGFDGSGEGINTAQLNQLACAGGTAPDFDNNCADSGAGFRAVESPSPSRLFKLAESGDSLDAILNGITEEICCGCVQID